jgi:hypothetical protein
MKIQAAFVFSPTNMRSSPTWVNINRPKDPDTFWKSCYFYFAMSNCPISWENSRNNVEHHPTKWKNDIKPQGFILGLVLISGCSSKDDVRKLSK